MRYHRIPTRLVLSVMLATLVACGSDSPTAPSEAEPTSLVLELSVVPPLGAARTGLDIEGRPPAQNSQVTVMARLTVHGFLTEAAADVRVFDGDTLLHEQALELPLGIPEGGTFDYRNLALQFRYEIRPKDILVIQLSARGRDSDGLEVFASTEVMLTTGNLLRLPAAKTMKHCAY